MLEANEMKVPRKIVGKTKIDRIRSQKKNQRILRHPTINDWVGRRRRERD
jgi:hypothetical protein